MLFSIAVSSSVSLGEVGVLAHAEKLGDDGILDELQTVLQRLGDFQHLLLDYILVLGHQHSLIIL